MKHSKLFLFFMLILVFGLSSGCRDDGPIVLSEEAKQFGSSTFNTDDYSAKELSFHESNILPIFYKNEKKVLLLVQNILEKSESKNPFSALESSLKNNVDALESVMKKYHFLPESYDVFLTNETLEKLNALDSKDKTALCELLQTEELRKGATYREFEEHLQTRELIYLSKLLEYTSLNVHSKALAVCIEFN